MRFGKGLLLLLIAFMVVAGCKSKTIEEEFAKTHTEPGQEILFKGIAEHRPFVIYKAPFANGKVGAGISVFEGSEDDGWGTTVSQSISDDGNIVVDAAGVVFADGVRRYFVYGFIDDPAVSKIEITDKYDRVTEARIVETNWKRIWYGLVEMDQLKLKAYNNHNEVIMEVPAARSAERQPISR